MSTPLTQDVIRFFHPVLPEKSLRKAPVRVVVADRAYALFRDARGRPAALLDRCPHRFAPLSSGRVRPDGRLACSYHGWHFDAEGRGASPTQPSLRKCDTLAFQVVERWGHLFLAAPETPLSAFPELDAEGFEHAGSFSVPFSAPLHVVLDNFSEDEHVPFVHTRLGWDEAGAGRVEFRSEAREDRTTVSYRAPQRPSVLLRRLLLLREGDVFQNDWETRFDPVRTVYTLSWTSPEGELRPFVSRAAIFFVPETATTTRLVVFTFAKVADPRARFLLPVVKQASRALGWLEVLDDARFIPTVAATPFEMKGMRLGRFDAPLVHNHRLLRRIYLGEPEREQTTAADEGIEVST